MRQINRVKLQPHLWQKKTNGEKVIMRLGDQGQKQNPIHSDGHLQYIEE